MKNNLIIIFICFIIIFVTGCDNESNNYSTAIDNSKNINTQYSDKDSDNEEEKQENQNVNNTDNTEIKQTNSSNKTDSGYDSNNTAPDKSSEENQRYEQAIKVINDEITPVYDAYKKEYDKNLNCMNANGGEYTKTEEEYKVEIANLNNLYSTALRNYNNAVDNNYSINLILSLEKTYLNAKTKRDSLENQYTCTKNYKFNATILQNIETNKNKSIGEEDTIHSDNLKNIKECQ